MTATQTKLQIDEKQPAKPAAPLPAWRRGLVFGTGFGIALDRDLHAAVVRVRASGPSLISEILIPGFRERPAAEWGAQLTKFLASAGERHLAATVLLPRGEVIVRSLDLPGVSDKDAAAAIELQIETLHPYGAEEVAWSWSRTGPASFTVGIVRTAVLDAWETLFNEAGIALAAIAFSSSAAYAALRLWNQGPGEILCF